MTEQAHEFLKELTALTHKYKIVIGGCGCCGSPHINPLDDETLNGRSISNMRYTVDKEGDYLTFFEEPQ